MSLRQDTWVPIVLMHSCSPRRYPCAPLGRRLAQSSKRSEGGKQARCVQSLSRCWPSALARSRLSRPSDGLRRSPCTDRALPCLTRPASNCKQGAAPRPHAALRPPHGPEVRRMHHRCQRGINRRLTARGATGRSQSRPVEAPSHPLPSKPPQAFASPCESAAIAKHARQSRNHRRQLKAAKKANRLRPKKKMPSDINRKPPPYDVEPQYYEGRVDRRR